MSLVMTSLPWIGFVSPWGPTEVYDIGRVINCLKRFPLLPRSVGEQLTRFRLSLSAESASHSAVVFSHNKSANSTFCHGLSSKRII
jgi:hypothetical protein